MTFLFDDEFMTTLCLWREARGEGVVGMKAVSCVIRNRCIKNNSTPYDEVNKPWAFSSITAPGDAQLDLFPKKSDLNYIAANKVARDIFIANVPDITIGATLYWNPAGIKSNKVFALPNGNIVKFPQTWDPTKVVFATQIGNHIFLREL